THLYTSEIQIADFPGKVFSVEEVIPFNKKALKELAKRHPKADLTARNFPLDTNALKKLSGIKDGGNRHIFAVTLTNGDKVLIITAHIVYL
ncbi:MAG: SAM-dependent methyltransferase, partial [Bacteroidales bacterium]|nr:SAM-dependent methyltransferase [Bacteroidales bacterium]